MRALHQDIGKPPAPHDGRAGSALIAVLGVSMILMLAGVTMVVLSRQAIHRVQRMVNYEQAQAVAEAGVADMVAKLGANYTLWQNSTITATFFSNGTYYVTSQLQTNNHVLITSDGLYMGVSNRTILELLGTVQTHNNDSYDTNGVIMSEGDIVVASPGGVMNGNVFGNDDVWTFGTVNGNIAAVGNVIHLLGPCTGTISNGVPSRTLPEFNFDSYRQMATNGGTYYASGKTLSGKIATPPNGVIYVNGDLLIFNLFGNGTFSNGTIVANGNITSIGRFTVTQTNSTTPSLLSKKSIGLAANQNITGAMYAKTGIGFLLGCTVNAGIISGGPTILALGINLNARAGYPAWDPLNPEVPPEVIVGGWLK
ncbi:MAG: hypothetical protein ABIH24_05645 [Verrucomicrobiota bacterium]